MTFWTTIQFSCYNRDYSRVTANLANGQSWMCDTQTQVHGTILGDNHDWPCHNTQPWSEHVLKYGHRGPLTCKSTCSRLWTLEWWFRGSFTPCLPHHTRHYSRTISPHTLPLDVNHPTWPAEATWISWYIAFTGVLHSLCSIHLQHAKQGWLIDLPLTSCG